MKKLIIVSSVMLSVTIAYIYSLLPGALLLWFLFIAMFVAGLYVYSSGNRNAFVVIVNSGLIITVVMATVLIIADSGLYEAITSKTLFRETNWSMYVVGALMTALVILGKLDIMFSNIYYPKDCYYSNYPK